MKGIVFTGEKGAEVLDGIEVRDPGPGEVIVKIMAAGVCHSDITAAAGSFNWPAPAVLGHEGAGIVEQVGTGVTNVEVGDHIIVSTLAACGMCKACGAGKPDPLPPDPRQHGHARSPSTARPAGTSPARRCSPSARSSRPSRP